MHQGSSKLEFFELDIVDINCRTYFKPVYFVSFLWVEYGKYLCKNVLSGGF